jgi:hypothetical protein
MKPVQSAEPSPGRTKNGALPFGLVLAFHVYAPALRSGTFAFDVQPKLPWLSITAQFWPPYSKWPSALKTPSIVDACMRYQTVRSCKVGW